MPHYRGEMVSGQFEQGFPSLFAKFFAPSIDFFFSNSENMKTEYQIPGSKTFTKSVPASWPEEQANLSNQYHQRTKTSILQSVEKNK